MPSYRYPVPKEHYHQLEAYYFRLCLYLNSPEFVKLSGKHQEKIYAEIGYIETVLHVLEKIYVEGANNERPVYAWPVNPAKLGFDTLFKFSCLKVAAIALGVNKSKVSAVCTGKRKHTGGWYFVYQSDYDPKIHGNLRQPF